VMMGDEHRGLSKEGKRFQEGRSKAGMLLDSDVGFGLKRVSALGEAGWEHQEPDIVKKGSQLEMVQLFIRQRSGLSHPEGDGGGAPPMPGLPGKGAVDLLTDLADQDAFDLAARPGRNSQAVGLSEKSLYRENRWTHRGRDCELHTIPFKNKEPETTVVISGSGRITSGLSVG